MIAAILVLIASVVLHELSHGFMAERLGDGTAREAGRLTLNPLKHLDPVGSFLVPLALVASTGGSFVFGWAKPVPYNPYRLRNRRWGPALVGAAGPLANIGLAIAFGLTLRWGDPYSPLLRVGASVCAMVVIINLVLALFNLIPIPPLDGSRILHAFLPPATMRAYVKLERYGFLIVVGVVYFLGQTILSRPVMFLFQLITGIS